MRYRAVTVHLTMAKIKILLRFGETTSKVLADVKIGVMYRFGAMGNMKNGARLMLHLATSTSSHQTEWYCCVDGRTFNVFLKQYMRILVQQRFDHEKRDLSNN